MGRSTPGVVHFSKVKSSVHSLSKVCELSVASVAAVDINTDCLHVTLNHLYLGRPKSLRKIVPSTGFREPLAQCWLVSNQS